MAFFAAFKAAARSRASPVEVSHDMTLPARFTRTVMVIVPEIPRLLALSGYSAFGSLISAPASASPVTGRSSSGFATDFSLVIGYSVTPATGNGLAAATGGWSVFVATDGAGVTVAKE